MQCHHNVPRVENSGPPHLGNPQANDLREQLADPFRVELHDGYPEHFQQSLQVGSSRLKETDLVTLLFGHEGKHGGQTGGRADAESRSAWKLLVKKNGQPSRESQLVA
jgi:hypothetical protein